MSNEILIYEKRLSQQLIRVSTIAFNFSNRVYPSWYPIVKDTRICCHYHLHDNMEMIIVDEGSVVFSVRDVQYELSKNDMLIINPFELHSASIPAECTKVVYHAVNVDLNRCRALPSPVFVGNVNELINGQSVYPNVINDDGMLEELRKSLKGMVHNRAPQNEVMQLSDMFRFFAILGQPLHIEGENDKKRSAEFIKKTVLYVQSTPLSEISLEGLARLFSYNKAYFTTLFKKNFGVPFTDYLNNYKIEVAKEYIRNGNYNLNEVAVMAGFNHYAYFFTRFKSITGMTPSEFVERCRTAQ